MSPGLQQWADSMEKNVTAVVPQSIKAPKSEATEKSQKTETSQVRSGRNAKKQPKRGLPSQYDRSRYRMIQVVISAPFRRRGFF